jgi:hypothetical protein
MVEPIPIGRRAYSIREVCEMYGGLDDKTVRGAILRGELRATRVRPGDPRSKFLILARDLDAWDERRSRS